jgi:F-type H+-transporting ATPase subunit delta
MAENEAKREDAAAEGTAARRLANVYAEALLNSAEKANKAELIEEQLDGLQANLFSADGQAKKLLTSKAITRNARTPLIQKAFEKSVDPLLFDFIQLLNAKERTDVLVNMAGAYRALRDERAKRQRVLIRTAVAMNETQRANLQATLESKLKCKTILVERVEPDLLGGLIVQVGDEVFDNSVRTRMETLRNQLLARSSYEIQIGRDRFSSPS